MQIGQQYLITYLPRYIEDIFKYTDIPLKLVFIYKADHKYSVKELEKYYGSLTEGYLNMLKARNIRREQQDKLPIQFSLKSLQVFKNRLKIKPFKRYVFKTTKEHYIIVPATEYYEFNLHTEQD